MQFRRSMVVGAVLVVASSPMLDSRVCAAELKAGMTLDSSTAAAAKDLLPPEILAHYEKNEYVNKIVDWPDAKFNWPEDFQAASKKNEGKYDLAADGHVVEKGTDTQPPYVLGFPFPNLDPQDPAAATKAIWNFFYRTWYFGNLLAESQLNMINPTALERRLDVVVYFKYFDGVPEKERPENKGNFLTKFLNLVVSPADVNGTANITWRYRDPGKRDSSWAYVPALRRVRQVSPANRSDGFLGSDTSQDDGPFFDGKVEDFTWKYVKTVDQLRIVDPLNLEGKSTNVWKDGGWDTEWPDLPFIGYMKSDWKGLAWAPVAPALAKRRFYVIEAVPKDRYYLYGKLQMYIDTVTFQGAWDRKFDWRGELLNVHQVLGYNPQKVTRPDGTADYVQGSNMAYQTNEAVKLNRATVAGIKTTPTSRFLGRGPMSESIFDLDTLAKRGK
jgi:Protein of unknown function (DUF1329)